MRTGSASPTPRARTSILGVEIDALTMDEAIAAFQQLIAKRDPAVVLPVNVDVCMRIQRDGELRDIVRSADLVFVDGTPMMWAARFLGRPFPERVSGSDFIPAFCAAAARNGQTLFLLGGRPGIADDARLALERGYPGLRVVGTCAPPLGFEKDDGENARIVAMVREARPDVLLVALGCPKQEKWLARFRGELDVPVAMGVGSTLDYIAGRLKRAPGWMQRAGIEWVYRLLQEPGRLWKRYLIDDAPFVYRVVRQRLQQRDTLAHKGGLGA